jgi:hypothetical protein
MATTLTTRAENIYYYTSPGGGYSTGMLLGLIDKDVQVVFRDGVGYRKKEAALPSGKEFNFDSATGEISFDTTGAPLVNGETIDALFQDPTTSIGKVLV